MPLIPSCKDLHKIMIEKDLETFHQLAHSLLKAEEEQPVVKPLSTEKVMEQLQLHLHDEGLKDTELQELLENLILHTPRTATRGFFNQLFGGRHGKAILGELLSALLNNSMYTYKAGGPMIGVEKEILRQISLLVGYGDQANGTIAPGGSMTNFMALLMGRDAYLQSTDHAGVPANMILYTSKESHYSVPKNAAFAGIGRQNVRFIATDEQGCMKVAALEEQLQEDRRAGLQPFFINATAGTTVMGAFDPLEKLADLADRYKLWLHVDGAYCGSVIFSDRHRHLVEGAQRAHSYSFNAHKMLSVPLSCSIIVTRDPQQLYQSFANDADYLYQTDEDDWNPGKTSLQCGRRNDALKFWTLWKAIGTRGLKEMVEHQFHLADVARDYIRQNSDYTLFSYDESIGVCFNYQDIPPQELCTKLYEEGELMVGYGQSQGQVFIRLVTVNASNTKEDILNFFQQLESFVARHWKRSTASS